MVMPCSSLEAHRFEFELRRSIVAVEEEKHRECEESAEEARCRPSELCARLS